MRRDVAVVAKLPGENLDVNRYGGWMIDCSCCGEIKPFRWIVLTPPGPGSHDDWWCCSKTCADAAAVRASLGEPAPGLTRARFRELNPDYARDAYTARLEP